tara:strand:+ start:297 stop:1730 length:1434 start_codon:yes stop_codon:yes gene_type:complete
MKSFFRKVAFGLGPNDNIPSNPLEWALNQLDEIPEFTYNGKIPTEKELRLKLGEFIYQDRKVLREKYKSDKKGYLEAKEKLRHKTGHRYWEALEYNIRHNQALNSPSPVLERFWFFWSNHFAIAEKDLLNNYTTGAYTREIIRPNLIKSFEQMCVDATVSHTMMLHLDNDKSVGPNSVRASKNKEKGRPPKGINENHARELLELHTVSPECGYTQEDINQLALIMTGWGPGWSQKKLESEDVKFDRDKHEPGKKTVLGKTYLGGKKRIFEVIKDLSDHPSCRKFIATKLVRHFITDEPTEDMINPIVQAWEKSNGNLPDIHKATIKVAYKYNEKFKKFQNPEVWFLQTAKMSELNYPTPSDEMEKYDFKSKPKNRKFRLSQKIIENIGHKPLAPEQPNGWSDLQADWISPELLVRRLKILRKIWGKMENENKNEKFAKNIVFKNFDNPDQLWSILIRQSSLINLYTMIYSSPEMLKA